MKGWYFKDASGVIYKIISDITVVRNKEGFDDMRVVAMGNEQNQVIVINILDIRSVVSHVTDFGFLDKGGL